MPDPALALRDVTRQAERMIGVLYEHPAWFARLFEGLAARGVPHVRLDAAALRFTPAWWHDPASPEHGFDLVINRMSPSADRRGHAHAILPTLQYLESLEEGGVRVVNGAKAYRYELSKARQMALLADLGLPYPATRVINHAGQAVAATVGLRFPVVVKPSVGGSGAGVLRFDRVQDLQQAVDAGQLDFGVDQLALVQEFIPARGGHITRVEVLNHRFLYAIDVHLSGSSFNLCPADLCDVDAVQAAPPPPVPVALGSACPVEAPKGGVRATLAHPPAEIIDAVVRMTDAAGFDVGGVEYVVDDRDGRPYFYDVNALSNFVADAPNVIGFDPWEPFLDFLVGTYHEASRARVPTLQ
jgi:glutathione synthase/RimK-type ligase-like ATP-grasp enzyme